ILFIYLNRWAGKGLRQKKKSKDVIDIIQNGESEVEMELNDTNDSDEDSDEDVCQQVDKENQPPMDCLADDYVDMEPKTTKHTIPRDRYRWLKKNFISPNTDFSGLDIIGDDISLHTPLEYFQNFVSEDMTEALTQNTNEYSFQTHGTSVNTTAKEIEKMFGMYLKMSLVQMAGTRMYWETETRDSPIADVMPRNRFQSLLTSLHFVNNMTVSETENKDKLRKLRPWLDSFRETCLQVVPEEHNSVDEMMIPFKGKFSSIKQYVRSKPNPWGFKVMSKSELGLSGDVVMKLASTLPEGQNYKMYADNYFTCVPLLVKLLDRGIHYVGTARQVRLPNCNLEDEKSLKKKGRGRYDVRVEGNHNICAVKWYDNRAVTLLSSFAGPEPVQKIQRWDKANRTYIEVERPYIVGAYNKYMGSFTAKCKFPIKSCRWYMYIFWDTIILSVRSAKRSSPRKAKEVEKKRSDFATMTLQNKMRKLIFEGSSSGKTLKLIKFLQKKKLLIKKIKCRICHKNMKMTRTRGNDHYSW
uniref:PiggyBac transposable element-derived protein domain-containing protein n=1 Tax=Cyprinodon variegatus TaxID=28743 RepID=A0A3Q2EIN5_CYPVA